VLHLAAAFLLEIRYPWIDPVALELPGPVDVRWYGLMYLVSFTIAFFVLRRLSRDGFLRLHEDAIGDLIMALVLGVILGARIGYILFYDFAAFAQNPARMLRIWEGGLSFHGGLAGVVVASWWFIRKHRVPYMNLLDSLALAIPFGIFLVRGANFVNGELYGRITGGHVPWAMRFPTDPVGLRLLGADALPMRERERAIGEAYRSGAWDAVRDQVPLRHPSQLYEALLEGVLLAIIVWAIYLLARRRNWALPRGLFAAIFFFGYGIARSFVELYRQPDAQFRGPDDPLGTVLGPLTMGQTLSLGVILAGVAVVIWMWMHRHDTPVATPAEARPRPAEPAAGKAARRRRR
jgi:phosphatidylglycerol---prolipoprotein diacylglyceryl transferase